MKSFIFLAAALVCAAGCSKKSQPTPAPDTNGRQSSVAELLSPAAGTPPAPVSVPASPPPAGGQDGSASGNPATKADPAIPPDMARHGQELARVMMLAQKHAMATGHFPQSWDEMIAAKLITKPPVGKNGQPMTWKEFVQALDK